MGRYRCVLRWDLIWEKSSKRQDLSELSVLKEHYGFLLPGASAVHLSSPHIDM